MNELVYLKKDDAFTDSMVIAKATENQHNSVMRLIKSQRKRFEKFGKLKFMDLKSKNPKGGRPIKYCELNEPQATLLISYLDNSDKVADFKVELVRQFFEMRKILAEKKTVTWLETRQQGKLTRKAETDVLKQLVEYAKGQGSKNAEMLYMVYSKLANKLAGIKDRETATVMQLNNLSLAEHIILTEIKNGIIAEAHYKDIYKSCKARLEALSDIAYLEVTA